VNDIALLVKSYSGDLHYAERLFRSIRRHNVASLPVFLVVPDSDIPAFEAVVENSATIIPETTFAAHLVDAPVAGISAGYMNQEIIKLAFWETGLSENYFSVDSDAEFIRDFTAEDFLADGAVPYTLMSEDADLHVEPGYFRDHWQTRAASLERLRATIGYEGLWPLTVHGHAIFSSTALRSFKEDFLDPRGWDYVDALAISPYEPSWYTAWVLHAEPIPIVRREPLVKTFHTPTQHLEYVLRGVQEADVARGYLAVVVNSNFSRGEGVVPMQQAPHQALASYVSTGDLVAAIGKRIWLRAVVEQHPLRSARRRLGALALRVPGLRNYVDTGSPSS
jgi:hypothetical protein